MSQSLPTHLHEAQRLLHEGFKLCLLKPYQKRPVEDAWNDPANLAKEIDPKATGYGLPLALNKVCSVDPDHLEFARAGLKACGWNLEDLMAAGVRTSSSRPNSGGRSTFLTDDRLSWVKFVVIVDGENVTALELRADSDNLQDCVPGVRYHDKQGTKCTQRYATDRRLDEATDLPEPFADWWARLSIDGEFLHSQQRLFAAACGSGVKGVPSLPTKPGASLPFSSPLRMPFNAAVKVEAILDRNRYVWDSKTQRYSPPSATGAPGVRPIPGRDGLWRSDHGSDPLSGTFDSWCAFVVLEHGYDVRAAEVAARAMGLTDRSHDLSALAAPTATHKAGVSPLDFLHALEVTDTMVEGIENTKLIWHAVIAHGHVSVWAGAGNAGKSAAARAAAADLAGAGYQVHYFQEDAGTADLKRLHAHAKANGYALLNSTLANRSIAEVMAGLFGIIHSGVDLNEHVFVFDTLKKFVDALSKREAKDFFVLMRSLTVRGATVLLLGHTNKHVGQDGKPVFEGVGDIRNDVDELIYVTGQRDEASGITTITLEPDKVRCLAEPLSLEYDFHADSIKALESVRDSQFMKDQPAVQIAVAVLIERGTIQKTDFVSAIKAEGVAKRDAERIVTAYSRGPHKRWTATAGVANNAKLYSLDNSKVGGTESAGDANGH